MKKTISALIVCVLIIGVFAGCGSKKAEESQVGMPNPMTEVEADSLEVPMTAPEGASNVMYFVINDGSSKVSQMNFTLDGKDCIYRAQHTSELSAYDISGIFSDKWESENTAVEEREAVAMTCSEGSVIYWLDIVPGIDYSLSCGDKLTTDEMVTLAELVFECAQGEA